jgi:hypothetical protein
MASKHAALYFEAYKQHYLVCSSLHTLSCARCLESKVVVLMGESPRQPGGEFRSHGTVDDEAADLAACDQNPHNNNMMDAVYRPSRNCLVLQTSASACYAKYDWYLALSIAVKRLLEWHYLWMPDVAILWISCTHANG